MISSLHDFSTSSVPYLRGTGLWNPGLVLTLHELIEASEAVRAGVLSEDSLKSLGSSCLRLSGPDPGTGDALKIQALHQALKGSLRFDGLDYHSRRILAQEIETGYLLRWGAALNRQESRPKPERSARCIAGHLLDLGFSPDYLHRWWKFRLEHEPTPRSLTEILDEVHALACRPQQDYQVLVVLMTSPRTKAGYPSAWLDSAKVSHWLKEEGFDVSGIRPSGGLVFER